MQCCGPDHCAPSLDEYVCQALKLLPDFSGKLDPDGNYVNFIKAMVEAYYDCVVQSSCDLLSEFNPCTSELYLDQWLEEYELPFRCPLEGISAELELELRRLQLCLQVQLEGGATFNQALIDQIAAVLGINYNVTVPTRNPDGVDICEIIPLPPTGFKRCNPVGCTFQQAAYINVTCAPSDAHIAVLECFISELTPCHVVICVIDQTPRSECLDAECTELVIADCLLKSEVGAGECSDQIEI